jgi:NADH dehydrogenase
MQEYDWIGGPIAITGASGQVGMALQKRLSDLGNEVRALDRGDDLRRAFRRADAVVHLAGGLSVRPPDTYETANLDTVRATVDALDGSGVRRVVFLSFITADPASDNAYLRAKGQAEELLADSGQVAIVFRTDHIYGDPGEPGPTASEFLSNGGRAVSVLGDGTQELTPIYKLDVVEAIVRAALDPSAPTGTFELAGPRTMSLDAFAQELNGHRARLSHTPAWMARGLAHMVPALTPTLVDVMLRDAVPTTDPQTTAAAFGITLREVKDVWGRSSRQLLPAG